LKTHLDWEELSRTFAARVSGEVREWISSDEGHYDQTMAFGLGRLTEGRGVGQYVLQRFPGRTVRCLDLGAGGGGVSLGLGNYRDIEAHAVDVIFNSSMYELRKFTGLPIKLAVGTGESLPYADASFDAVLCLETIEHVHRPNDLGAEIMRILKPGGFCMVTTPSRLRHLLKPDPHFGVRGLLLLPDALQPFVAKVAAGVRLYDVVHIFWSVDEIAACFPAVANVETMWDRPRPFASRWKNDLWDRHRHRLWDRIVLFKG
jgi:SAM-dependent methyltransferase